MSRLLMWPSTFVDSSWFVTSVSCFLKLYKLVDKSQYFDLYSLHCCTLQMAPWIFLLTCYTHYCLLFYLEGNLLLDLINLFTWLMTVLQETKNNPQTKNICDFILGWALPTRSLFQHNGWQILCFGKPSRSYRIPSYKNGCWSPTHQA